MQFLVTRVVYLDRLRIEVVDRDFSHIATNLGSDRLQTQWLDIFIYCIALKALHGSTSLIVIKEKVLVA